MTNVNYIGAFDSLEELWSAHPEGGIEGDYALVGAIYYGWDKYRRTWETTTLGEEATPPEEEPAPTNDFTPPSQDEAPEERTIQNVNYLGEFSDMESIWAILSEGGHIGDYLTIDGEQYSWNPYLRDWTLSEHIEEPTLEAVSLPSGSESINYLGNFASIEDVWAFYPEGGNRGDYVAVGGEPYKWNVEDRAWGISNEPNITVAYLTASPSSNVRINYLGSFEDRAAVWVVFPEGGYEGDYVHIDEEIQVWNKYGRDWGDTSDPVTPAIKSQTLDSSLVINYDLTVVGAIHGNADNAIMWDFHRWSDYMNQALRKTDAVQFLSVLANRFSVNGGSSSQFLKADGSLDQTDYISSARLVQALLSYATTFYILGDEFILSNGETNLASVSRSTLRSFLGISEGGDISDLFVKESDGKGGYRIKARYGLYSDQFISAGGAGEPGGGGGGAGALYELIDILRYGDEDQVARDATHPAEVGDALVLGENGKWHASESAGGSGGVESIDNVKGKIILRGGQSADGAINLAMSGQQLQAELVGELFTEQMFSQYFTIVNLADDGEPERLAIKVNPDNFVGFMSEGFITAGGDGDDTAALEIISYASALLLTTESLQYAPSAFSVKKLADRITAVEQRPGGVTSFGSKLGDIDIRNGLSQPGDINLEMNGNQLIARIVGLGSAAFEESSTFVDVDTFETFFQKVNIAAAGETPRYAIKVNPDYFEGFMTEGFVTAGGDGNPEEGESGALYALSDVLRYGEDDQVARDATTPAQSGDVLSLGTDGKWHAKEEGVKSFNGRNGDILLRESDITAAKGVTSATVKKVEICNGQYPPVEEEGVLYILVPPTQGS